MVVPRIDQNDECSTSLDQGQYAQRSSTFADFTPASSNSPNQIIEHILVLGGNKFVIMPLPSLELGKRAHFPTRHLN